MKHKLIILTGAGLLALTSLAGAQATTTPVGYITHEIAGNAANNPFGADTLLSPTLVGPSVFSAASTNALSGGAVINVAAVPAAVTAGMYVEITSGDNEGWWSNIASVTGTSITIADNVPVGSGANTSFVVRKHTTLADFLGANNSAGLDFADEVQILNASTGVALPYNYATAADGAETPGWYDANGVLSNDVPIYPGTSILVRRKAASAKSLVSVGHVKTTKTQVDLFPGENWISPQRATGVSLADSNLDTGNVNTGVNRGDGTGIEDEVIFINPDQSASVYFAAIPTGEISGWVDPNGNPAGTIAFSESKGAIIKRKGTAPAIWTVPAVTIGN